MERFEGTLISKGLKIAIVGTRWNELIVDRLIEGAKSFYIRHGGKTADLALVCVPGTVEIPLAVKKIAASRKYQGIVALGCVIQGETENHTQVAGFATNALSHIHLEYEIPIGFGILTTNNFQQATDRADGKKGNKGEEAMSATIEMINLMDHL